MAESAPPAAAVTKAAKKKSAAKRKRTGPSVGELIVKAVSASKERSGVSLATLKKALAAGGYDVEKNNSRVKIAVKSLVTKGTLVQNKGIGSSDSFKLNKKQAEIKTKPANKAAPKAKKPAAKKPAAARKPKTAAAKKPTAKKSPKKAKNPAAKKTTKSPKKAKKPATPKKAAKSPKKTKAAKPKTQENQPICGANFTEATIPVFTSLNLLLQRENSSIFLLQDEMIKFIRKLCFILPTVLQTHHKPHTIPSVNKENHLPGNKIP
ncbi:histone H1-like [Sinocyclocheilus rhinocerous]|uniref:histone H1-like n=1 Tax=Sinocyclocheilus rhinocerous TaxID=307959 RepID=UPI0007B83D5E|nr:PREDICTED: histone H1-like [Sinocyclocheilus rhinocerous]